MDGRERSPAVAEQFGINLRRERKAARLTQGALGERAGLHRTEIGKLEVGYRVPRLDTVVKLCVALNIQYDDLLRDCAVALGKEQPR